MVEPVHPFECRKLDGLEVPPRTMTTDHFGLVQPDHRLGEGVVVRVADAPDRRINAGVCQAVGVTNERYWVNSTGRRNTSMMRCCDGATETETVRPSRSACDAFARSPASRGAGGATTVLEGDRPGAVE